MNDQDRIRTLSTLVGEALVLSGMRWETPGQFMDQWDRWRTRASHALSATNDLPDVVSDAAALLAAGWTTERIEQVLNLVTKLREEVQTGSDA